MRVPSRRITPRMNRPIEYANHNKLTNPRPTVPRPILNTLKSKRNAAIEATTANSTSDLAAAEIICATTYSRIESGVINMLLKLCDQTFHSAPNDMEYCVTRMISHISVARQRYCATDGFNSDARKPVQKQNVTAVSSDQQGR